METVTLIAISVVTGVVSLIIYVLFLKPGAQEEKNKAENEKTEEPKKERNPSQSGTLHFPSCLDNKQAVSMC